MAISMNSAISAYRNAALQSGEREAARAEEGTGETFAGLVKDSLQEAVRLGKTSEEMSLKGMAGDADMQDVVLALNSAENALSTVVAVRDKVVSAYQEILRMSI